MAASCPNCGAAVESSHKFCPECGTALGETAAPADPFASSEQRRTITVLFADLAGFTFHTERSDPEDVRARLTRFHTRAREDVERYGGRVEKLLGDGVFAVFGAPVAHEDDPARAVRAALRLQESIGELNDAEPDLGLSVRVAVTTGEAIVQLTDDQDREGIVGDVVNTASRLEAVAEPGTVVVDERTYLAARSDFEFAPLDPVTVKGKVEPLAIWRPTEARSRYGVAVEEEVGTPFVGRRTELSLLMDAFERSVDRRSPQLVTVVGEPGVGKSRLVREFRHAMDNRPDLVWWRQGRCLPYGEGVTFWAIGEVVKAQAGILESESPATAAVKLREAVAALVDDPAEVDRLVSRLAPLAGTGTADGADRSELFAAWLSFFEALAARNPLVLVIEDLHWADDAIADFLEHLVDWAQDSPILLVTTARPEVFEDRPSWGGGKRDAVTVSLSPLDDDDTKALLAALSGRSVMDADAQQALLERSGGNPLYVTEYVALATERGWLDRPADAGPLPLPDSVQAVVAARLDLLAPDEAALIEVASVVGKVFWTGALTFAGVPGDLATSLRHLVQRELIRPVRRPSMQGQEEYTFAHVLVRDVAYARLTRDERARLHESTARWLEAVSTERAADVAELLAHHFVTALELRPSDDPEKLRRAYRFLVLAAERAASLDVQRGSDLYRSAVGFAQSDAERGRALMGQTRHYQGDVEESHDLANQAIEAFVAAGDAEGRLEALSHRAGNEWFRGMGPELEATTNEMLDLMADMGPSATHAQVLASIGGHYSLAGKLELAIDLAEQAMEMAQVVGDTQAYALGLKARSQALQPLGRIDEAAADGREALAIFQDRGESFKAMSMWNGVATFEIVLGDIRPGKATIDEAIAYARERNMPAAVHWSEMTKCEALYPLGEWDEIVEIVDRIISADEARGGTQLGQNAAMWKAEVDLQRDRPGPAHRVRVETLPFLRGLGDPQVLGPALAAAVESAFEVGEHELARAWAEDYLAFGREHPGFVPGTFQYAAEAMVELGMVDAVRELARIGIRSTPWTEVMQDAAEALVMEAEGDHEGALERYRKVWEVGDPLGQAFESAMARYRAARCLVALGRHDAADVLLADAESAAERMGATRLLRLIDELRTGESADAARA